MGNFLEWKKKAKDLMNNIKKQPCMDCGKKYPKYVMSFDHRNPVEKYREISHMVESNNIDSIKDELLKTDLVCLNCHRIREHRRLRRTFLCECCKSYRSVMFLTRKPMKICKSCSSELRSQPMKRHYEHLKVIKERKYKEGGYK